MSNEPAPVETPFERKTPAADSFPRAYDADRGEAPWSRRRHDAGGAFMRALMDTLDVCPGLFRSLK